jgi:hypothetical protein
VSGGVVEELGEGECGLVLHAGDDVLVGGHRESWGGVAEPFGDDFDGDACFEEQGGVGVAEVVEPDSGWPGSGDELLERVREKVWGVGVPSGRLNTCPSGSSGSNSGSSLARRCLQSWSSSTVLGSRLMLRRAVRDLPRVSWSS